MFGGLQLGFFDYYAIIRLALFWLFRMRPVLYSTLPSATLSLFFVDAMRCVRGDLYQLSVGERPDPIMALACEGQEIQSINRKILRGKT